VASVTTEKAAYWPRKAVQKLLVTVGILVLAYLIALLPVKQGLVLIGGSAFAVLAIAHPIWLMGLLTWTIPFGPALPGGQINMAGACLGISDLVLALLLALWLLTMLGRREVRVPHPPLLLPLLAFIFALGLSLLTARSLSAALPEMVKWLEVLALYLCIIGMLDQRHVPKLVAILLLAGGAEATLGLYQFVRRVGPEPFLLPNGFLRAYGSFHQPNPFAGYLGLLLPLAVSLTLWAIGSLADARRLPLSLGRLVAYAIASLLLLAGIIASWSRGAWLGVLAALAVVTVLRSRHSLLWSVTGLVLLAGLLIVSQAGIMPTAIQARLGSLTEYTQALTVDLQAIEVTDENFAVLERAAHWQAALGMFRDHLWLGVGIGNYPVAYPDYAQPRWQEPLGHAHNYYLNIAAETGIVGLAAYATLWIAAAFSVWRVARTHAGFERALAIGVLGTIVHLSVHNLFDNLYVQHMYLVLATLLAISHRWVNCHVRPNLKSDVSGTE